MEKYFLNLTEEETKEILSEQRNLCNLSIVELDKKFNKIYERLAMKYGQYDVFDDCLDMAINSLCINYSKDKMEFLQKKYSEFERANFTTLIYIWLYIMEKKITDDSQWFDFWGTKYEENAITKQKGFAQYFTPETIAKFMAEIVTGENEGELSMMEPACGSGRMNLAFNSKNLKNVKHFATDLDFTCVRMATLNFFIHGIKGIVICDDSLFPFNKSLRGAFIVNELYNKIGIYYTESEEEIKNYININTKQKIKRIVKEEEKEIDSLINKEIKEEGQLKLF